MYRDIEKRYRPGQIYFGSQMKMSISRVLRARYVFAFLPQFVDPARGSAVLCILTLGVIFVGMAIISDSVYALAAGTAGNFLAGNARVARAQKYLAGTIYLSLRVTIALLGGVGTNRRTHFRLIDSSRFHSLLPTSLKRSDKG